jgi:hypothetical protein
MLGLSFQIVLIVAGPIDFLMESFIKVRKETLLIVAVMHLSREPETWKSRLKKKEL